MERGDRRVQQMPSNYHEIVVSERFPIHNGRTHAVQEKSLAKSVKDNQEI